MPAGQRGVKTIVSFEVWRLPPYPPLSLRDISPSRGEIGRVAVFIGIRRRHTRACPEYLPTVEIVRVV